jgi:RimJ/RimL family protein N-acetyltransferase
MALDRLPGRHGGTRVGALLLGCDEWVTDFVAERIGIEAVDFGPCTAIGVVRGGAVVAGVVYHEWREQQQVVEMSVAADTPRWASPDTIASLLSYPFLQLGCRRIGSRVRSDNERSLRFTQGLGFLVEGILADWYAPGIDCIMMVMQKAVWRDSPYGQG